MATIVWTDSKGKVHRSHTLDPGKTQAEIASMGGTVTNIEKPSETRVYLKKDPETGRIERVHYPAQPIGEAVVVKPVVELTPAQQKIIDILKSRVPPSEKFRMLRKVRQDIKYGRATSITQKQYLQEVSNIKSDIGKKVSEYGTLIESIDPNKTYVYEGSHMLGSTLKAKLKREYEPQLRTAEKQSQIAWQQARDIPKDIPITKTKEGYTFDPQEIMIAKRVKRLKELKKGTFVKRAAGFGAATLTPFLSHEDFLGIKSTYQALTGDEKEYWETKAKATLGLDVKLKEGIVPWAKTVFTGPLATTGIAFGLGAGIGTGIGAFKATALGGKALLVSRGVTAAGKPLYTLTAGKALELGVGIGFGALAVKETVPVVQRAREIGDYGELAGHLGMLGATAYFGFKGYKVGHAFGYGRTEAIAYRKAHFKSGSAKDIQFKEALAVSRRLESVKSHRANPLDIAIDIMRLDKKSAARVIRYLRTHPKTVVGGSAASLTQIEGARTPRDIDLLIRSKGKKVTLAKKELAPLKTKEGRHMIDIHGKEFYDPGKHHRFGFRMKEPTKIGDIKFMKAGEQLFRKGIASVLEETEYRHFKDLPDFLTHAKSLIKSGKLSKDPFTKLKAVSAEKHLEIFIDPKKSPLYGKTEGLFGKVSKKILGEGVTPEIIPTAFGLEYVYPSYTYPSVIGLGLGIKTDISQYPKAKQKDMGVIGTYAVMEPDELYMLPERERISVSAIPSYDKYKAKDVFDMDVIDIYPHKKPMRAEPAYDPLADIEYNYITDVQYDPIFKTELYDEGEEPFKPKKVTVEPIFDIDIDITAPIFRKRTFPIGDLGKELTRLAKGFAL